MLAGLIICLNLLIVQGGIPLKDQTPLALNFEVQSFLDDRVNKDTDPLRRLESLVDAVFRDSELHFTYSDTNRTANETFTEQNGNCLSFTLLFVAMARHVGLDARFQEIEIAPTWTKTGIFISLNQHVNAAVIIDGLAYAIDVFPGVNRIELGIQIVPDKRGLAHFYNNRGVDEMGAGSYQQAETYLEKALETDSSFVSAWINLGALNGQLHRLAEAERCYRKALSLDSKNLAAMSNLANLCDKTGRTKEADRLQSKVRSFREKNPYHHYNLGQQALEEGRFQDAIDHYKKALKLKSREHNFHFGLARAFASLGNPEEAVHNLQLATKYTTDPSNKTRYSQKLQLLKSKYAPALGLGTAYRKSPL